MAKQWLILRCKNADTLPLLRSLTRAGLDVWTPTERVTKRVPRANIKRKLDNALLPSYVFAAFDDLADLTAICDEPVSQHRAFRIFYWHRKLPLIADATLGPLRDLERDSMEAARRDSFKGVRFDIGSEVRLTAGSFEGLTGEVEGGNTNYTTVRIKGFNLPLKIANYHLLQDAEKFATAEAA